MTSYFGKNLKFLRISQHIEQADLAEQLGKKGGSSIANWEKGTALPNANIIREIATLFEVSIDELLNQNLTKQNGLTFNQKYFRLNDLNKKKINNLSDSLLIQQKKLKDASTKINIYGAVSAGTGEFLPEGQHVEEYEYIGDVPPHDYAVIVNGLSMKPMFDDKQVIFVNKTQEARSGQIVIARYNGSEVYVKKFVQNDQGCRLVSLNKDYQDMIVDDNHPLEIMGTVIL